MASGFKSAQDSGLNNEELKKKLAESIRITPKMTTKQNDPIKVEGDRTTKENLIGQPKMTEVSLPKVEITPAPATPAPATPTRSMPKIKPSSVPSHGGFKLAGSRKQNGNKPGLGAVAPATENPATATPGGPSNTAAPLAPAHPAGFIGADGAPAMAPTPTPPATAIPSEPGDAKSPGLDSHNPSGTPNPQTAPHNDTGPATNKSGLSAGSVPPVASPSKAPAAPNTLAASARHRSATPTKYPGSPKDTAGKPVAAHAAPKGAGRLGNFAKRHPKGTIAGILGFISAIGAIIMFMISLPFQMIQMAQMLLDHNFKASDRIEQKATENTIAHMLAARAIGAGTGAKYDVVRHPIAGRINNMAIDKFNAMLDKEGFALQFDKSGRLVSIVYKSNGNYGSTKGEIWGGEDLKNASFYERRGAIKGLVNTFSEVQLGVLKRTYYTKVMKYHARVSFRFWPKEKVNDVKKLITEKVRQGATAEELLKDDPTVKDPAVSEADGSGDANDAVKEAEESYAKNGDKSLAIRDGIAKFQSKNAKVFGITGILAMVCAIQQMANDAANTGYKDRAEQLMRTGNVIPTMRAQMYTGEALSIEKFGQTMELFNGNSKAPANSIDRKGWDQSAAKKRIDGDRVITDEKSANFNPDFSEASNPDGFALQKIVSRVNSLISFIPGAGFTCKVLNSFVGIIIGGVELSASLATAGTSGALALALKAVVQGVIMVVVLPKVLAAAANLAITGTENSVDFFNNADAGLQLSVMEVNRSKGGRQMSDSEHLTLVNAAHQQDLQIAREKGWTYRTLALDNTQSTLTKLIMKVPNTPSTALATITQLPQHLYANLGTIFFRPSFADGVTDTNPYQFQFYGFTDAELDKYPDPVANEDYLTQDIPGTTETRLSMLGSTGDYSPADGDDPDTNDLMHCFVNKFRTPEELKADSICKGLGQITARNGSTTDNPGNDIVAKIYADNGVNIPVGDDFTRYRMQLLYTNIIRGLECSTTTEACFQGHGTAPITETPTGTTPAGNVQELAKKILALKNVSYWTNDIGINTRDVFEALAAGKSAYTTCGNAGGAKPDVNLNILQFIYEVAAPTADGGRNAKIMVNALTDKCHSKGSNHYTGEAVDLERTVGSLSTFQSVAAKYGGKKNSETSHHHFDFVKGSK